MWVGVGSLSLLGVSALVIIRRGSSVPCMRRQVDDVVASNALLYAPGEAPDHCVVIKYVPYVADSKRALDEYSAEVPARRPKQDRMQKRKGVCLLRVLILLRDFMILGVILLRHDYTVSQEVGDSSGESVWSSIKCVY